MYFIQTRSIIGYCLELDGSVSTLVCLQVTLRPDNLTLSSVNRCDESVQIYDVPSLSNFIVFSDRSTCFSNEGSHVLFLESGFVIDHSFANKEFAETHLSSMCSNISALQRVGDGCEIVARCQGTTVLFTAPDSVHGDSLERILFSEDNFGQVFVCPNQLFVSLSNNSLSVYRYSTRMEEFLNATSFPFQAIRQGNCLIVGQELAFVATLGDGRSFFVDFVDSSYHLLGASDSAGMVPSKVKGHTVVVNNRSETLLYNLTLSCGQHQEPIALPDNFVLINFFSTSTTDMCQCPIEPNSTSSIALVSSATTSSTSDSIVPTHSVSTVMFSSSVYIYNAMLGSLATPSSRSTSGKLVASTSLRTYTVAALPFTTPSVVPLSSQMASLDSPLPSTSNDGQQLVQLLPVVIVVSVLGSIFVLTMSCILVSIFIYEWHRKMYQMCKKRQNSG